MTEIVQYLEVLLNEYISITNYKVPILSFYKLTFFWFTISTKIKLYT